MRARSDTLGTLEVRRDRSGLKLMAHGILYSIRPDTAMETPAPWLALAAAPWVGERAEGRAPLRILILGYGGGTVARLIRGLDRNAEIIGVEPDPGIRRIAATEMGVRALGATVVGTDACSYLSRRGPVFDAVIDDVFAPRRGRLARPGDAVRLPELVRRRLKPGGVYAVNLISPGGAEERATVERVRAVFRHVMVAYLGEYAHKIVIASDDPFPRGALGRGLRLVLFSSGARRPGGGRAPGRGPAPPTREMTAARAFRCNFAILPLEYWRAECQLCHPIWRPRGRPESSYKPIPNRQHRSDFRLPGGVT